MLTLVLLCLAIHRSKEVLEEAAEWTSSAINRYSSRLPSIPIRLRITENHKTVASVWSIKFMRIIPAFTEVSQERAIASTSSAVASIIRKTKAQPATTYSIFSRKSLPQEGHLMSGTRRTSCSGISRLH